MIENLHSNLANGRWEVMSLPCQMGNIGSEISRALRWKKKNNIERMTSCVDRALDLIDLSLRWAQREQNIAAHPGALRELTRLRESVCDFFLFENEYCADEDTMLRYFDQFALIKQRED